MTWVVGVGTIDFGVLASDIRLSYSTAGVDREEERFGVQKIHCINPSTWIGFSGSVDLGFAMVDRLRRVARAEYERSAGPPELSQVVEKFVAEAHANYSDAPEELRSAGCRLLVVAVPQSWVEHEGKRLFRVGHCFRISFPAPGDRQTNTSEVQLNHFAAIGAGSRVPEYVEHLNEQVADGKQGLLPFAPNAGHGFGGAVLAAGYLTSLGLGSVIEDTPVLGISSQMHSVVVTADGSNFGSNAGADVVLEDRSKRRVPDFPPVATTIDELDELCRDERGSAIAIG